MNQCEEFVPTDQDRQTVRALTFAGASRGTIARCVGAAGGISQDALVKHFQVELDTAVTDIMRLVVETFLENAKQGNRRAMKLIERRRWPSAAGTLTRAELASLEVADIQLAEDGALVVTLRVR